MLHFCRIRAMRKRCVPRLWQYLKHFIAFDEDLCKFAAIYSFYQNRLKTRELLCFTEVKCLHLYGSVSKKMIPKDFQIAMMFRKCIILVWLHIRDKYVMWCCACVVKAFCQITPTAFQVQ